MMSTACLFWWFIVRLQILSPICCQGFVLPAPLLVKVEVPSTFSTSRATTCSRRLYTNFLGDLWNELIEFSTLGPGERKLLQARRREAAAATNTSNVSINDDDGTSKDSFSVEAFQAAKRKRDNRKAPTPSRDGVAKDADTVDDLSLDAFESAVGTTNQQTPSTTTTLDDDYDGYSLRDLLVSKWGAPLDVCFQRQPNAVYCTVLPVAFGNSKCQHINELDYLMHLQATVEILRQYRNLDGFVAFVETTTLVPKPGTCAVPYRLVLEPEELQRILGQV